MNIERLREERKKLFEMKRDLDIVMFNLDMQIRDLGTEISRESHVKMNEYIKAKGWKGGKEVYDG